MLAIVIGHRTGRLPQVGRLADFAERNSGIPGWASLPLFFVAGALLIAVLGMYWDISIHIDEGRDPGPLANAAHYFILAGLFGVFFAGLLSMALPREGRPSPAAVKISGDWYAPLGGLLMTVSASFALGAFPLDDVWHRIFGQDVTLWGPTHLVLIGGAGLATVGSLILLAEGVNARATEDIPRPEPRWLLAPPGHPRGRVPRGALDVPGRVRLRGAAVPARLAPDPADAGRRHRTGVRAAHDRHAAARCWPWSSSSGSAAVLSLWVGPLTGHTALHFPLYIVEALVVEAGGPARGRRAARSPSGPSPASGIGTLGLAAEWALVAHLVDDPVDLGARA